MNNLLSYVIEVFSEDGEGICAVSCMRQVLINETWYETPTEVKSMRPNSDLSILICWAAGEKQRKSG